MARKFKLNEDKFKVAFIFANEGCNPKKDRSIIESEKIIMYVVGCADYSQAETVAQEELSDANITSLSLNADTFTELASGKVDAVVNSDVVAQQYAISNSDYTILDVEFASAAKKCQAAVRKGDTGFLDLVNKVIKENQDNGNFDKWIQEYSEQAAKEAAK